MNFLLIALGIFVLIQLINGIVNIQTARFMKRRAKLQAQIDEEESRLMSEQWELVIHKFSDIMEKCLDLEDKIEYIMENIDHHTPEVQIIPKKRGKRGKYGPRKPKVLDHKKTPPE